MESPAYDEIQTRDLAAKMAKEARPGDIFCLSGPLGAGKSVFARAFIRELCGQNTEVPSPTFTLVQTYEAPAGAIWHFDLYRLKDAEEVYELGWEDALAGGIVLVEWPQRLWGLLPARRIDVTLAVDTPETRKITVARHGL